jgi:ArsR family transcriptional regulator
MKNVTTLFKTLSDESRLRIYCLLHASGELCVCDIESTLSFTQTKVSRHLAYLRRAGLIKGRKHGTWMYYSVTEPIIAQQIQLLQEITKVLKLDPIALSDVKRLEKNGKRGCCDLMH